MPIEPQPPANHDAETDELDEHPREKVMGFFDHLEELRWTLVKCAIVVVSFAVLSGVFLTHVRGFLEWPWYTALAKYPDLELQLRTDTPMEIYGVMVQICVTPALVASMPFLLFFVGQFIGPALTAKEKRLVAPAVLTGMALFVGGAAFSFLLLVPASVRVAIDANEWMGYQMIWTVGSYYSLMTWLVVGMGVVFEFPLIVLSLSYLGIVEVATFRKSRRLVVLLCFVVAAIITPTPDPITQCLVAAPLWLLFEVSLLVAAAMERRKAKADAANWRETYGE